METKALKKQLGAAIAMVLVAAIALAAATFAWFVNNNAVKAEGVDLSTSSSVPNLYITSAGKTTDGMTAAGTNPTKLFPVSTNMTDIISSTFYETLSWANGDAGHAVANAYQPALEHEKDKTVYADYTFDLGVANGKMDVYFDSANKLKPSAKMGTAGRFAISFDGGKTWKLFKVDGKSATDGSGKATGYYTDQGATTGDYWVMQDQQDNNKLKASAAQYGELSSYTGSVNEKGQAQAGTSPLITLNSADANGGRVTVTIRVWYEGCDKDCVSENAGTGISSAISGNLGFVGVQSPTTPGVGA